ncbi:MAG: hypothetical protein ACREUX_00950 [Burkholderiales bacterium]
MGILDWLRLHFQDSAGSKDPAVADTLARIVQLANPRLVFAHRYKGRLMPAVRNAMNHAGELVAGAAPAREASTGAWQSDPCIRAMFANAKEVTGTFSRSPEVRQWFTANPAARDICAVLSMQLVERRVLGSALEERVLRGEVAQTTINFTDYRVRICAATESELRNDLERRIVDQLALSAIAAAAQVESRRSLLERERALLRTRLRLLEAKGAGISGLGMRVSPQLGELARVQMELAVNDQDLRALSAGHQDLDHQVECLCAALMNPADHFSVSERRLRLDNMNVLLPDASTTPGATLEVQIARVPIPNAPAEFRTFVFAHFPRAELLPQAALLRAAAGELR